jgi:hypothetical protein
VTSEGRAFVAVDAGTATNGVSLIGRVDGAWRLLGSTAASSAIPLDALIGLLARRASAADPDLARDLGLPLSGAAAAPSPALDWPRLHATSGPPPRLAVVGATARAVDALDRVARSAGWEVESRSVGSADVLEMTNLLLRPDVAAVLAGAGDPAGGDERGALPELAALVGAALRRRPELTVVLAGALAEHESRVARDASPGSGATEGEPSGIVVGPSAQAGNPPGTPLRALLDDLARRTRPDDARRAIVRTVVTLASVLDRSIEAVDVGASAALRVVVVPGEPGSEPDVRWAVTTAGALVPEGPTDEIVDGVLAWSVVTLDRHRMRDRLHELRAAPWGDADGDGALLRLAAARAAVTRLVAATPAVEPRAAPDLILATGGAWAVAPGPAIALALADVLRRPGASQLAYDHARLLGPLGSIDDPGERRSIVADLADDLLAPLGGVVVPAGLRPGRSAGRLVVHAAGGSTELDLVPGGLELVDLPPGESAVAELQFRDQVSLGTRGRRFALELGGGLGGLLIDLRDVPLRLPDRSERRRDLLGAWQQSLWAGLEQ